MRWILSRIISILVRYILAIDHFYVILFYVCLFVVNIFQKRYYKVEYSLCVVFLINTLKLY